jgi:hypothetical protein
MSPQEEETFTLAAIARLGEASAHEIATELGVVTIRHTLGRLVDSGRAVKRLTSTHGGIGQVWVYCAAPGCKTVDAERGRQEQVRSRASRPAAA